MKWVKKINNIFYKCVLKLHFALEASFCGKSQNHCILLFVQIQYMYDA